MECTRPGFEPLPPEVRIIALDQRAVKGRAGFFLTNNYTSLLQDLVAGHPDVRDTPLHHWVILKHIAQVFPCFSKALIDQETPPFFMEGTEERGVVKVSQLLNAVLKLKGSSGI